MSLAMYLVSPTTKRFGEGKRDIEFRRRLHRSAKMFSVRLRSSRHASQWSSLYELSHVHNDATQVTVLQLTLPMVYAMGLDMTLSYSLRKEASLESPVILPTFVPVWQSTSCRLLTFSSGLLQPPIHSSIRFRSRRQSKTALCYCLALWTEHRVAVAMSICYCEHSSHRHLSDLPTRSGCSWPGSNLPAYISGL